MNRTAIVIVLCLAACSASAGGQAGMQAGDSTAYVTVVPGAHYQAGAFTAFFLGAHWRTLWTTPIRVPVLDLGRFAGGLTPAKTGGGQQTKSLRLKGADGKEYKFRSLDKNPEKTLPPELRETVVSGILQDQISSANPAAPLVVAPILSAVGILNTEPVLVWMPDDERLGTFRQAYANLLGTIEINPREGSDEDESFGGADKIHATYKMFERMEQNLENRADGPEYLKARLVDMFLGDWDRHTDQWKWAGYKHGKFYTYKPIPRDRDQAFSRFDGLFPWLAAYIIPQIVDFERDYPPIEELTWSGRFIDRRILPNVTRPAWDSVTAALCALLTDSLLSTAVHRMPPEMYAREGQGLYETLRLRRDKLPEASCRYRHLIMEEIDLRASTKDDRIDIRRLDNDHTNVRIYPATDNAAADYGHCVFDRTFDNDETSAIRIHTLGGADRVTLTGTVDCGPEIVISAAGDSIDVADSSRVKGYLFGVIPFIPFAERKTIVYDDHPRSHLARGAGTVLRREPPYRPATELLQYEPIVRDWGEDWFFSVDLSASTEDGIFVGGRERYRRFAFRTEPYDFRISAGAGIASRYGSMLLDWESDSYGFVRGARTTFNARYTTIQITSFFGLGNATPYSHDREEHEYYRVAQRQVLVEPGIEWTLFRRGTVRASLAYKHADVYPRDNTLLNDTKPFGCGELSLLRFTTGVRYDSRDVDHAATRGMLFDVESSFFPSVFRDNTVFQRYSVDIRAYHTLLFPASTTVAFRIAGERVNGRYPFFEAAYLGGGATLRGFSKQRFAGDASFFGTAEVRTHCGKIMFLVPCDIGLLAFGETGRVWLAGESSARWHAAGGGGIYIAPVSLSYAFAFSIARSAERFTLYASTGFAF